jgi:putative nucleotidyltransferase with HDIG domain
MELNPLKEQRKIAKKYKIGYYSDIPNFDSELLNKLGNDLGISIELINLQELDTSSLQLYSTVLDEIIINSSSTPENLIEHLKISKPFIRLIGINNIESQIRNNIPEAEIEKSNTLDFSSLALSIKSRSKLIVDLKKLKVSAKETNLKFIMQLVSILENKDPYTKDHSARVAKYAQAIATQYFSTQSNKMNNEYLIDQINLTIVAAWAHDIGKTSIASALLNKDSKLTNNEYDIIKMHADFGAEMIRKILGNEQLAEAIENHHERIDGQGYHNLEDFSDIAKIIAIADSFDAMTTTRPYTTKSEEIKNKNKLKTLQEAIMELQISSHLHMDIETNKMSQQLDTSITDIFVQILKHELELIQSGKLEEAKLLPNGIDANGYIKTGFWNDKSQLYIQEKNISDNT